MAMFQNRRKMVVLPPMQRTPTGNVPLPYDTIEFVSQVDMAEGVATPRAAAVPLEPYMDDKSGFKWVPPISCEDVTKLEAYADMTGLVEVTAVFCADGRVSARRKVAFL